MEKDLALNDGPAVFNTSCLIDVHSLSLPRILDSALKLQESIQGCCPPTGKMTTRQTQTPLNIQEEDEHLWDHSLGFIKDQIFRK